jgi:hypothetical protein
MRINWKMNNTGDAHLFYFMENVGACQIEGLISYLRYIPFHKQNEGVNQKPTIWVSIL